MMKTLNQIIFCFLHQNQNIFFSNIGNQNIFLEKVKRKVSGTSIRQFNIVCDIPVATLRLFPYVWFNFRITCCRFNAMLSNTGNYYNMCHYSLYKNKAFLGVVIKCPWSPFWWFTAWNIHVCQSSPTWDHMTATFKNACWASIIFCTHLI